VGTPRSNELDEQKPADDRQQSKEQIEEFFRHLSLRFAKKVEQCRDRYENRQGTMQIDGSVLKCLQDGSVRMPFVL
jgi:hypothetical protein